MSAPSGRAVAFWAVSLTVVVLVSVGIVYQDRVFEAWHIWKFESASGEEKWALAEKLEEQGPKATRVAEDWYIGKLDTDNSDERKSAAEKLGEMGSVRAVLVVKQGA